MRATTAEMRRPGRPVAVVLALWVVGTAAASSSAGGSSSTDRQSGAANVASSPHFARKSDRLEAIKRYILERLNVSDSRRLVVGGGGVDPLNRRLSDTFSRSRM